MSKNIKKLKIAIIYGGKSVEHEVSLMSAKNVAKAMNKSKYQIIFIKINKDGKWSGYKSIDDFKKKKIDVVFPILHGPYGEDGTVQGLLKLAGIPFVGPSVLGSSVGFDKDITKRLLTEAKIPNTKFMTYRSNEKVDFLLVNKNIGMPIIIKPANSGSSVGISKAINEKEFKKAIDYAFKFDSKIIIEEFIQEKREIECAILGNQNPKASVCGEVITNSKHKFYSYEAKYFDPNGAILEIPAKISKGIERKIKDLALMTFKILELEGMSGIDFFVRKNGQLLINEVNTIPGFTNISMYPTLWKNSGVPYSLLIDKLIEFAIERFNREQKLQTTYIKK